MGVGRTAWQASLATALLLVGCAPGDADTTDPAWEDGAPVPAEASVDDDVGPRPGVDAALPPDDGPVALPDAPPALDAGAAALLDAVTPAPIDASTMMAVDVAPAPVDAGPSAPVLPELRCRVQSTTYDAAMQENPAGPAEGSARVTRGGGFNNDQVERQRATFREGQHPNFHDYDLGVRCAYDPSS